MRRMSTYEYTRLSTYEYTWHKLGDRICQRVQGILYNVQPQAMRENSQWLQNSET